MVLVVVLVVVVVLFRKGCCGVGGSGEGLGRDEVGDCNHGNAIYMSFRHACVCLDALEFQLSVCGGSYYCGGESVGRENCRTLYIYL